jgi:hypothetical protein
MARERGVKPTLEMDPSKLNKAQHLADRHALTRAGFTRQQFLSVFKKSSARQCRELLQPAG